MRIGIAILAFGVFASAADEPKPKDKPAEKNDPKALSGRWRLTGTILAGRTSVARAPVFHYYLDDESRGVVVSRGYMVSLEGSYFLSPREHPRAIDLHITPGQGTEQDVVGIYEIDGETLKIATLLSGERPKVIDETPKARQRILVLKREPD